MTVLVERSIEKQHGTLSTQRPFSENRCNQILFLRCQQRLNMTVLLRSQKRDYVQNLFRKKLHKTLF